MIKVDYPEFRLAIERAMRSRVKRPVDVCLETGLFPQQLYQARNKKPTIDVYLTVCDWIGVPPMKFTIRYKVMQKKQTIDAARLMQ